MTAIQTGLIQFYDRVTGKPVASGQVATLDESGMPKTTYSDAAMESPNDNPVQLDSAGTAKFYGTGQYVFKVYSSVGQLLYTVEDIGSEQAGSSVLSSESPDLLIGEAADHFTSADYLSIHESDATSKGKATIEDVVVAGNAGAGGVAGEYDQVMSAMNDADKPAGLIVIGESPSDADPLSTRLYQLQAGGTPQDDPGADAGADPRGVGESWVDLMRMAVTEEARIKKMIMQWDEAKEIVSSGTLTYPIMVWGSDGSLYQTTGQPTAEQILTTNPVNDTGHAVWTYVYDPSETAQYPPGYRSANCGVDQSSGVIMSIPQQSHKLVNSAGVFVDDGDLGLAYDDSWTKDIAGSWVYGDGESALAFSPPTPTDGWYEVHMIKTTSGDVDFMVIGGLIDVATGLAYINALAAEIAAGRTWYANRRIATIKIVSGAFVDWDRSGNEYFFTNPSDDITWSGSKTANVVLNAPPDFVVRGSFAVTACTGVGTDSAETPIVKILGSGQTSAPYTADFIGSFTTPSNLAVKTRGGFEFVRKVDANSQVYVSATPATKFSFAMKTTSYIDPLND